MATDGPLSSSQMAATQRILSYAK